MGIGEANVGGARCWRSQRSATIAHGSKRLYSLLLRVRLRSGASRARLPEWKSGAKMGRMRELYMQWPRAEPRLRIVSTPQGLAVVVAREWLDDMIEGVLRREMLWA